MLGRLRGFLRDAWWLLLLMAAGGVFFWVKIAPILGACAFAAGVGVCGYFAIQRYDNDGNPRPQGPS